jgi:hypothetical protein
LTWEHVSLANLPPLHEMLSVNTCPTGFARGVLCQTDVNGSASES